jgi:nucleotide sugar dehydrogenase
MKKFGIFGQGFVGNSIKEGFKDYATILTYDKYRQDLSNSTPEEIVRECDIIFSCVPTPMDVETGEASIHIVEEVITSIDKLASELGKQPTIIIKSTVPPGTTNFMNKHRTTNCNVVFNPEFLTEANAVNDFKNQDKIILGVDVGIEVEGVIDLFTDAFPEVPITIVKSVEAEMMKYVINNFLSVKISFLNEIYDICQAGQIDYKTVSRLAKMDQRLGDSHWMVPGPDGDRGFGGHCLPKDLQAMRFIASQLEVNTPVLNGTLKTNDKVRTNRDWEQQEGRAIINK